MPFEVAASAFLATDVEDSPFSSGFAAGIFQHSIWEAPGCEVKNQRRRLVKLGASLRYEGDATRDAFSTLKVVFEGQRICSPNPNPSLGDPWFAGTQNPYLQLTL